MAADPRKRQKKQERRAANRKSKHQQLTKVKSAGLAERITGASRYPIRDCWVSASLWSDGLGYVCLSRQGANRSVAFVVFLVDRYCLGVKDAIVEVTSEADYTSRIVRGLRAQTRIDDMQPAAARKLVEGAVEYARSIGLHPHPDYQKAKLIFGDIDAGMSAETFEFGKDGKPFFVSGPNDTPARCRQILGTLERTCGSGAYHYMMPLADIDDIAAERLERSTADEIGWNEFDDTDDEEVMPT